MQLADMTEADVLLPWFDYFDGQKVQGHMPLSTLTTPTLSPALAWWCLLLMPRENHSSGDLSISS